MMFSASDEKNSFSSVFHDIDHQPFLQRSLSAPAIAENVFHYFFNFDPL